MAVVAACAPSADGATDPTLVVTTAGAVRGADVGDGAVSALHGSDLPFVFGTHGAAGWWDATADVERLP